MLVLRFFCDISLAKESYSNHLRANIKSHTEPIFQLYNLLKIEDIYKSKLLILYYKILRLSSSKYFDTFIPKNSAGVFRYPIRNPRWQSPARKHTYSMSPR